MYGEIMVIVVLITIIHPQDLIVMDRPWWLCRDTAHLHEEDTMGMVEAEEEGGKIINFESRSLLLRLFLWLKRLSLQPHREDRLYRKM